MYLSKGNEWKRMEWKRIEWNGMELNNLIECFKIKEWK